MKTMNWSHLTLCKWAMVAAACVAAQSLQASLLFSESFNYNTGNLGGNVNPSSTVAWTGSSANLSVVANNLTYAGLADSGGNALQIANGAASSTINTFANQTSGLLYYSFLLNVTVADSGNNYFTAMNPSTSSPNGSTDAIDSYLYSNGRIGLRTAGTATTTYATALTLNTTYLVVLEYDFTAQTAYLFLNPTIGGSQPAATLTLATTTPVSAIDNVGFKAATTGVTGTYIVDNLLIGTTWADVTPAATPEPTTLALVGLGLAGLALARRARR